MCIFILFKEDRRIENMASTKWIIFYYFREHNKLKLMVK